MAPPDRPNVLVVMYDQLVPTALGCYGNPVARSPYIDAVAANAVVFDAAYANSPLCAPARTCLMTGLLPSATGGFDNASYLPSTIHHRPLPTRRRLPHPARGQGALRRARQLHGFEERRTTDIYPADFGWTPDWRHPDERIDWWYHNMSSVTGAGTAEVTDQLLFDDEVGHQSLRALHDIAREDDGRPFFMVASFTHPHDPYVARQRFWDLYQDAEIPLPAVGRDDVAAPDPHSLRLARVCDQEAMTVSDDDVRRARRAYLANVSYVDEWTGRIVATLGTLGLADDTVVVILSDHGDMLGERGLWFKMSFFEGSSRVALMIHAPDRVPAGRASEPVSLVDVLPTLLDLTGIDAQPIDDLAGSSLLPLCDGSSAGAARTVLGEYCGEGAVAPIVMIRRGPLKFVHCPADPDQLYDLQADPHELVDLARDPGRAGLIADLRAEVARRWDLDALRHQVLADQARRRLLTKALRRGRFAPWEYTPPQDCANEYMRNHLDLNEVERLARWPRA